MGTPQIVSTPVVLPVLGDNVTDATVTRWLKSPGDIVEAEEALLEVTTNKVDTEIPAPIAGTSVEILIEADQQVEVGTPLALIAAEQVSAQPFSEAAPPQSSAPATAVPTLCVAQSQSEPPAQATLRPW